MNLTLTIFNQAVVMFILILAGILSFRIKLISVQGSKELSAFLLQIVNPTMIFMAYQRDFDKGLLKGLLISLALSAVAFIIAILVSYTAIRRKNGREFDIERFSCIYSNCGFMGIPLINALLGLEGVFYITAFLTVFNILVWTHGLIQISGKKDKKSILTALRSSSVIATFAGLASFIARAFISESVTDAISYSVFFKALEYIYSLNTPLAMIVAGCSIAQVDLAAASRNFRVYYVSFIKLILVPLVTIIVFRFINAPENPIITVIVASAAPAATTGTLFALRYDRNYVYTSEIFAVTTLLSVLTMPLMIAANTFLNSF